MPKTKEEIRATTTDKIPRPANYRYGERLKEWDDSLPAGAESTLARIDRLLGDRILVRLVEEAETCEARPSDRFTGKAYTKGKIILTDPKPLIGGECREAVVLKCGPGKWEVDDYGEMWLRVMSVKPGQTVYIGNWVDLEANGLALCQEGDVRGYVPERQTAKNGAHREAQVSKGRHNRRGSRRARVSHAAKAL